MFALWVAGRNTSSMEPNAPVRAPETRLPFARALRSDATESTAMMIASPMTTTYSIRQGYAWPSELQHGHRRLAHRVDVGHGGVALLQEGGIRSLVLVGGGV